MAAPALKLSVYLGERDHSSGRLGADALMDAFERHGVKTSVLLRGVEGFGLRHRLLSEGSLTLSEDLPLVAIALDEPARIEGLLGEVGRISPRGLITLERARVLTGAADASEPAGWAGQAKLTVYLGRGERLDGGAAYVGVVERLRAAGLDGASVLLGVDGTANGERRRGSLLASNAAVPLLVLSVGDAGAISRAAVELSGLLERPRMTLERVGVCKRDGVLLGEPRLAEPPAPGEPPYWQKLSVYAGGRARYRGDSLHGALVRRLRREGAAGVTVLRGIWGYHGDRPPHGERLWSITRHVPTLSVLLDTPANARRWFEIVDELTAETGLVTSELVPALRAATGERALGGLALASPRDPWPAAGAPDERPG